MNETEFIQVSEQMFTIVEEWLEDSGIDLDFESGAGMLTITVEDNGSQIILSRQRAVSEVWVAAISGGFHFSKQGEDWVCKTGETLQQLLNRVLLEQAGEAPVTELVLDD
mgnify:CR=1 FL=1|jgi:CyaY protein